MKETVTDTLGVFVGRLNPIHAGHEAVINAMIDSCGIENSTVVLGSQTNLTSMRHFFSYEERRNFVKMLYPDIPIVGLADFSSDREWLLALDDLVDTRYKPENRSRVQFFGGSDEDVRFFLNAGRPVNILNRYDGTTPKISASEIRDNLLYDRSLIGVINPTIEQFVVSLFKDKWENFKRT